MQLLLMLSSHVSLSIALCSIIDAHDFFLSWKTLPLIRFCAKFENNLASIDGTLITRINTLMHVYYTGCATAFFLCNSVSGTVTLQYLLGGIQGLQ